MFPVSDVASPFSSSSERPSVLVTLVEATGKLFAN
jgi:hypothetical protein